MVCDISKGLLSVVVLMTMTLGRCGVQLTMPRCYIRSLSRAECTTQIQTLLDMECFSQAEHQEERSLMRLLALLIVLPISYGSHSRVIPPFLRTGNCGYCYRAGAKTAARTVNECTRSGQTRLRMPCVCTLQTRNL